MIIEALHIQKSYGAVEAVNDVSFAVEPGECFGILGPNGAGKTTTIRIIYGFSPLTGGTLKVFNMDIVHYARSIKKRIGVCQQENNLDPDLSVIRNLEVFARYFNIPRTTATVRAEELLEFMSLTQRRDAKANELSGGMMRRVVLARALINDPELLILDEPTTGLDPQSRHQVWTKLEELRKKGLTILLTTHYMDEAARLCDRLIILDQGKILVQGKPLELISRHIGRNIIEVDEPSDSLRSYLQAQRIVFEDLEHRLIICGDDMEGLYHEISHQYCQGGCLMRMATLEDVFLKLTGRDLREP